MKTSNRAAMLHPPFSYSISCTRPSPLLSFFPSSSPFTPPPNRHPLLPLYQDAKLGVASETSFHPRHNLSRPFPFPHPLKHVQSSRPAVCRLFHRFVHRIRARLGCRKVVDDCGDCEAEGIELGELVGSIYCGGREKNWGGFALCT